MNQLIKRYITLFLIAMLFTRLAAVILLEIYPDLLTTELSDGRTSTLGNAFLESFFEYLINIIFVILLSKDMHRLKLKSIPILIVTLLSSYIGILFFLFIAADKTIETENI
jgi:hypothetical protein